MTHATDFTELQELKSQFALISEKLDKQRIINEKMLRESMTEKLSHIEKWYRSNFLIELIAVPILTIVFLHAEAIHWSFIVFMDLLALAELALGWKCYRTLDPKTLPNLPMTSASERIARHNYLRSLGMKILSVPALVLMVWVVLVACRFTWKPTIIALSSSMIVLAVLRGISQEKANRKKLDEVLRKIEELRG